MPEYMTELGYSAGRLVPEEIAEAANQAGQQFGIDEIVRFFYRPYIYLNDNKITAAKLDPEQAEEAIANALTDFDGINLAVSTKNLSSRKGNPLLEQVRRNQHVTRSGNIYVIQEPYWFLFDEGPIPSMHGFPWRYNTHVPIIFAGPGIESQKVNQQVHPVDVSPTLAALLGITPPAAALGTILKDVLK